MPKVPELVRVRREWAWDCPRCKRVNHEHEMSVWNAADENKQAKVKCVCGQEVELSL